MKDHENHEITLTPNSENNTDLRESCVLAYFQNGL